MIREWFANKLLAMAIALAGSVLDQAGHPVAHATVVARGQNVTLTASTDGVGRFAFPALSPGEYDVVASSGQLRAAEHVEVSGGGTEVELHLTLPETIHKSVVVRAPAPPVGGSGTDVTLNQSVLARSPASTSFPNLLLQLPGAARGANGVVHLNGDHGDINYVVDGVSIPQGLNREIGSEFDVANAAYVDVMEGAYPAQYGGRFAAVVNIGTRSGAGPAGYSVYATGGSYATYDSSFEYHEPLGRGNAVVGLHAATTSYALDPPEFGAPHNQGSDANQFLRLTIPCGNAGDYFNFTLSHSYQTFQIPNAVSFGEPAATDDNETQNDTFASFQYRHTIGSHGMLSFGPSYKRSNIRDFGDPLNDFIFDERSNTAVFSLYGNATSTDVAFDTNYALQSDRHYLRTGILYDMTLVSKLYDFSMPYSPYAVVDNAPNVGHTESAYFQDSWSMGPYQLDYGLRLDAFQLSSTQLDYGASMFSPRLKFTRFFGKRASLYAYYGRFFTPFSFQNISPEAACLLNLPLERSVASFDLKPQRDSVYEIGGHLPLGSGDLGLRVMQKNATDLIDDTQVGVTAFHEDINYALGRVATQTAYYQLPLPRGGRFYASVNHTYSENNGCETQLLAPCFGAPTGWTPADHEQRWGATAGAILNDARNGWFSIDGEYGAGLSSSACAPTLPGYCKYTPHIVFDAEKGFALGPNLTAAVRVGNLLNDRYYITYFNAQGNHFSQGRTVALTLSVAR